MRIGELSASTGVSMRSLRYYEEQGLLHAERSSSGQRLYAGDAVERERITQNIARLTDTRNALDQVIAEVARHSMVAW